MNGIIVSISAQTLMVTTFRVLHSCDAYIQMFVFICIILEFSIMGFGSECGICLALFTMAYVPNFK